jgi:hypothetical protein
MGPQVGQEYILGLFINTHEYLYVSTWRLRGACVVWKCVAVPQPKRRILACKQIDRVFKVTSVFLPSEPRETTILSTAMSSPTKLPTIASQYTRQGNPPFTIPT